jgi:hypothetical protein
MAGGGLTQLVSYGIQDVYLTGNPTISFFEVTYRRFTGFNIEIPASNAAAVVHRIPISKKNSSF